MAGFITYILISVFTPGPNNIFASTSTLKIGFRKTLRFMLGVFVGTFVVFLLTSLLNIFLYENIRIITTIIGIVGGLFIVWLAVKMFLARKENEKPLIKGNKMFLMAVLINFINAKTIIFGLTVATFYLNLDFPSKYLVYFDLLMAVLCFIAVVVWGLFGKLFKEFLTKYRTIYNIIMALLLAYSGAVIIYESIF